MSSFDFSRARRQLDAQGAEEVGHHRDRPAYPLEETERESGAHAGFSGLPVIDLDLAEIAGIQKRTTGYGR